MVLVVGAHISGLIDFAGCWKGIRLLLGCCRSCGTSFSTQTMLIFFSSALLVVLSQQIENVEFQCYMQKYVLPASHQSITR